MTTNKNEYCIYKTNDFMATIKTSQNFFLSCPPEKKKKRPQKEKLKDPVHLHCTLHTTYQYLT